MKKIKIGIIGFGTIGSGLVRTLSSKRAYLREKAGVDIEIARICDKDLRSRRPVKVSRKILTKSIGKVLYDPDISIVVELIGGMRPAKEIILEALRQGKHVVTANKALLSESGYEIFNLANSLGLCVGFEASVGGGIPIIRALREGFVANRINLIYGIINGTSNFILSEMAEGGHSFKEALLIAQEKGYAERDPYLDISGGDSCHKLAVLALLGFGIPARPADIYTEGITDIEVSDIQYARELGYSIKLLAIAKRCGDLIELRVHPTLIPAGHLLANVNGVYNGILVDGDLVGENFFFGEGAGPHPTSSAVASDIVAIARGISCHRKREKCVVFKRDVSGIHRIDEVRTRYYIRFSAIDRPGVLARISGILGKHGISIASVTQKEKRASKVVPIVMMTHEARESDMTDALREIDRMSAIKKRSVRVRMESDICTGA
ncbi:MAG: homoserine dehydrogenase [Candidatus Omnitrophota bacterium]